MKLGAAAAAALLLPVLLIGGVAGSLSDQEQTDVGALGIPADFMALYIEAAHHFQIPAPILAAIGKVECDHGRGVNCNTPNSAGAVGPMQFLPSTFVAYASASGSPNPSIIDPRDAIFAAAKLLASNGVNRDPRAAVFSYNHSGQYVMDVFRWASAYAAIGSPSMMVVIAARSYLGVPYVWGGTSKAGLDCSGLVIVSFSAIGKQMPRVAVDQAHEGMAVPSIAAAQPGDLLAYGDSMATVDHIAIYSSDGRMIEAPHAGAVVREVPARTEGLVGIRRVLG